MSIDPAMMARVRRDVPYEVPSLRPLPTRVRFYGEVPAWKRVAKRAIDIAFSAVALVAFGLMLPFIALAIKLDSRGPVFYSQVRVGIDRRAKDRRRDAAARGVADRRCDGQTRDRRKILAQGHLFEIVKLRTMYTDSESDGLRWAHKGDPRITRVGRFLRVILAAFRDPHNRNDGLAGARLEQGDTARGTARNTDAVDREADQLSAIGHGHDLVGILDREARGQRHAA